MLHILVALYFILLSWPIYSKLCRYGSYHLFIILFFHSFICSHCEMCLSFQYINTWIWCLVTCFLLPSWNEYGIILQEMQAPLVQVRGQQIQSDGLTGNDPCTMNTLSDIADVGLLISGMFFVGKSTLHGQNHLGLHSVVNYKSR